MVLVFSFFAKFFPQFFFNIFLSVNCSIQSIIGIKINVIDTYILSSSHPALNNASNSVCSWHRKYWVWMSELVEVRNEARLNFSYNNTDYRNACNVLSVRKEFIVGKINKPLQRCVKLDSKY